MKTLGLRAQEFKTHGGLYFFDDLQLVMQLKTQASNGSLITQGRKQVIKHVLKSRSALQEWTMSPRTVNTSRSVSLVFSIDNILMFVKMRLVKRKKYMCF